MNLSLTTELIRCMSVCVDRSKWIYLVFNWLVDSFNGQYSLVLQPFCSRYLIFMHKHFLFGSHSALFLCVDLFHISSHVLREKVLHTKSMKWLCDSRLVKRSSGKSASPQNKYCRFLFSAVIPKMNNECALTMTANVIFRWRRYKIVGNYDVSNVNDLHRNFRMINM